MGCRNKNGRIFITPICKNLSQLLVLLFSHLFCFLISARFCKRFAGQSIQFFPVFFLLPTALPLVLVAWSLVFEVYFYLIFALIIRFGGKRVIAFLLVWLLFLLITNFFPFSTQYHDWLVV